MGSVMLPQVRLPQRATLDLLDWGADIDSPLGGDTQRLDWPGSRWAITINYPRLKPEPDGRILMAALRQAKSQGAIFPVPQPGFDVGSPGAPVVNGPGQLGSALALRGFTPGYLVRFGQKFSLIVSGQRYVYEAAQDALVDGNGAVAFAITPMIRLSPGDGEVAEFAQPYIEGTIAGNIASVEFSIARAQPAVVKIVERA